MKLKFLDGYTLNGSNQVTKIDTLDLDLCGQGRAEGNAAGLVPVKLPGGVVVTPMVTVTSATSTTKRSSRSAVVKVSMPYSAIATEDGSHYLPDSNRSGAEVSMHLVVALPAPAAKDIQGLNGSYSKYAAEAQIALLFALLRSVIGSQFGGAPVMNLETPTEIKTSDKAWQVPVMGGSGAGLTEARAVKPDRNVGNYGGTGFDVSGFRLPQRLNGFLARIASGLPMLSCGDLEVEPLSLNKEQAPE